MRKKVLSLLALLLMAATGAWAQQTLTLTISDMVMDNNHNDYCMYTDRSVAEGVTVRFDMMTWHTATGHIYINNEVVYTWTGSSYITIPIFISRSMPLSL